MFPRRIISCPSAPFASVCASSSLIARCVSLLSSAGPCKASARHRHAHAHVHARACAQALELMLDTLAMNSQMFEPTLPCVSTCTCGTCASSHLYVAGAPTPLHVIAANPGPGPLDRHVTFQAPGLASRCNLLSFPPSAPPEIASTGNLLNRPAKGAIHCGIHCGCDGENSVPSTSIVPHHTLLRLRTDPPKHAISHHPWTTNS